jgi:hypothetical protein
MLEKVDYARIPAGIRRQGVDRSAFGPKISTTLLYAYTVRGLFESDQRVNCYSGENTVSNRIWYAYNICS